MSWKMLVSFATSLRVALFVQHLEKLWYFSFMQHLETYIARAISCCIITFVPYFTILHDSCNTFKYCITHATSCINLHSCSILPNVYSFAFFGQEVSPYSIIVICWHRCTEQQVTHKHQAHNADLHTSTWCKSSTQCITPTDTSHHATHTSTCNSLIHGYTAQIMCEIPRADIQTLASDLWSQISSKCWDIGKCRVNIETFANIEQIVRPSWNVRRIWDIWKFWDIGLWNLASVFGNDLFFIFSLFGQNVFSPFLLCPWADSGIVTIGGSCLDPTFSGPLCRPLAVANVFLIILVGPARHIRQTSFTSIIAKPNPEEGPVSRDKQPRCGVESDTHTMCSVQ